MKIILIGKGKEFDNFWGDLLKYIGTKRSFFLSILFPIQFLKRTAKNTKDTQNPRLKHTLNTICE